MNDLAKYNNKYAIYSFIKLVIRVASMYRALTKIKLV